MRAIRPLRALALACVLLVPAGGALAHTRSTSYSTWTLHGREARVRLSISQLELTRLPFGIVSPPTVQPDLSAYLTDALRLEAGGKRCPVVEEPHALEAPRDRAVIEWRIRCPDKGALAIASDMLLDVAPSHLHFARLRGADGSLTERVLSTAETHWPLPSPNAAGGRSAQAQGSSLLEYVKIGIEHIASGYDHLVFLLGLVLLASRIREVVTIVSGFTVAHSITLALAALGHVRPELRAVEALIGLSIALVAAENAWALAGRARVVPLTVVGLLVVAAAMAELGFGRVPATTLMGLALFSGCYFALLERLDAPLRMRAAIAFCFGLVHGFGFAGVLTEMQLPRARLVPALFGFNIGVEIGQLGIVALVWPSLVALRQMREGITHRWLVELGTAAVGGLGVLWWVQRAYG